jgi:hypothetical protein
VTLEMYCCLGVNALILNIWIIPHTSYMIKILCQPLQFNSCPNIPEILVFLWFLEFIFKMEVNNMSVSTQFQKYILLTPLGTWRVGDWNTYRSKFQGVQP